MNKSLKILVRLGITGLEFLKSKYFKRPLLYIAIFYCCLLFIFLILRPSTPQNEDLKLINNFLYNIVNIVVYNDNGFYDTDVQGFIKTLTNSFGFVLSILSAIYIFTHREQKTVSPSASHNRYKNNLIIRVVFIILLVIITGYMLQNHYDYYLNINGNNTIHITNILHLKIYFWIFSLIISAIHIVLLVKYLLNSINVSKMLVNSIIDTSRTINSLINLIRVNNIKSSKILSKLLSTVGERLDTHAMLSTVYDKLHYNIESVFQNLKFIANHNMNKEFEDGILLLDKKVINKLKKYKTTDGKLYSIYLYENDQVKFVEIYKSFLRNILSLINYLYKEKHYNKARDLVSLYFSLYIEGEDNLGRDFMDSLNEFLSSLDTNDPRQLRAFLDELDNVTTSEQTLTTFHNLLMKLIIQDNVKVLTNVVYDFKSIVDIDRNEAHRYSGFTLSIALSQNKQLEKQVVYILLQCLLKSIEISHYSCAGFLVKYLITNFEGKDINESLYLLKKDPNLFADNSERRKHIMTKIESHKDIGELMPKEVAATKETYLSGEEYIIMETQDENEVKPFNMNKETFDYCLKKLVILLYGQQYYAYKNKLWFVKEENFKLEIDIETEFKKCNYSNYIIKKVKAASGQYGLIFFDDEETMDRIYSKCNIKINQYIGFV